MIEGKKEAMMITHDVKVGIYYLKISNFILFSASDKRSILYTSRWIMKNEGSIKAYSH